MILVIPESPSSPKGLSCPRKRGLSGPVSRKIASLTLAIFDSCGHCEEPQVTKQSPGTLASLSLWERARVRGLSQ